MDIDGELIQGNGAWRVGDKEEEKEIGDGFLWVVDSQGIGVDIF